ncbi:MAG: glycosyltransferase family 39 protein [Candidatus Melainabacteria bacterium]|nr:glycosyltransferase family 39 protein [Candidatus Melainabacteria bacterium]
MTELRLPYRFRTGLTRIWPLVCAVVGVLYICLSLYLLPICFSYPRVFFPEPVDMPAESWHGLFAVIAPIVGLCAPVGVLVLLVRLLLSYDILDKAKHSRKCLLPMAGAFLCLAITLIPVRAGWIMVAPQIIGLVGLVCLLVGLFPVLPKVAPLVERGLSLLQRLSHQIPRWVIIAIPPLIFFIQTSLCSYLVFEHIPHVQDSICQFFHAKMFALGHVAVPVPEPKEAFKFEYMLADTSWRSLYPPGHCALLALGFLINAPWIINPLLGSLSVLLLYPLGRELYGRQVGFLAMILAMFSPFLMFMSSEFMNHTSTLFFLEVFMLGLVLMVKPPPSRAGCLQGMKRKTYFWAAVAGAALGFGLLIRPLSCLAVAMPMIVYVLIKAKNCQHRTKVKWCLGVLSLCCGVFIAIYGLFNQLTNGSILKTGIEVYGGKEILPGFHETTHRFGHTPLQGLTNTLKNLNGLNYFLFGWPIPSLVFLPLVAGWKGRNIWDLLLSLSFVSLVAAYFYYWYQDWCFGPRFLFEASFVLILLTARCVLAIPEIVASLAGSINKALIHTCMALVLALCFTGYLLIYFPASARYYANSFWRVNAKLIKAVQKAQLRHAVVFVKSYYGSAFPQNSPFLDSDTVYVRYLTPEINARVLKRFKDRCPFVASGAVISPYRENP